MAVLAHGGSVGLAVELGPMLVLLGIGLIVWRRQRRSALDHEARVEEPRGGGE